MAKIQGKIIKFGPKGFGFIESSDGNKYFAHQKNIEGGQRLRVGTQVLFNFEETEKGLVAKNITLKNKPKNKNFNINLLLTISFIIHAITIYETFIK